MLRPAPQRIGSVISDVLKQAGERHGTLFAIQQDWKKLVGKQLAAHTRPIGFRRGRLIVCADRPGDSFTLSYQRTQLLERLQKTTQGRVEEIVIRPGDPPRDARGANVLYRRSAARAVRR